MDLNVSFVVKLPLSGATSSFEVMRLFEIVPFKKK